MKLKLLAALILLAGCIPPRPYPPAPTGTGSTTSEIRIPNQESSGTGIDSATTTTSGRDAYECEREAALSNVAGGKAEAFNKCMRARGRTPGR